jgi:hypothetical protein
MQYHLDTIPVWEAMERHGECPLCALEHKTELEEVERTLGASVMEPAERIKVNRHGICALHHRMLHAQQNRLGHALLMDSHGRDRLAALQALQASAETQAKARRGPFARRSPARTLGAQLQALSQGCVVCDRLHDHMGRYRHTFLHLWRTDVHFREVFAASHGVCVRHLAGLLQSADRRLPPAQQAQFAAEALALLTAQLDNDTRDLAWFTQKFDYRNQDAPWGESKTALERLVNRLRGWCLGDEPWKK